jgi:hypothetical protein
MPTIKVERYASDGPFRVGAVYGIAAGEADDHCSGIIVGVRPTSPKHVEVTVELSDAEQERLLESER